jgi:hypothetical protein
MSNESSVTETVIRNHLQAFLEQKGIAAISASLAASLATARRTRRRCRSPARSASPRMTAERGGHPGGGLTVAVSLPAVPRSRCSGGAQSQPRRLKIA